MCLLVLCKILRLFVNTMTADDKYSLVNRDNLTQSIRYYYLRNKKNFFSIFLTISKICIKFLTILKIWSCSYRMYFQNCRLRKRWLDKCLKNPVWEDPSTSNMLKRPIYISNLQDSIFTIVINPCEHNSVGKSLL